VKPLDLDALGALIERLTKGSSERLDLLRRRDEQPRHGRRHLVPDVEAESAAVPGAPASEPVPGGGHGEGRVRVT
jgi:hypothetical protein